MSDCPQLWVVLAICRQEESADPRWRQFTLHLAACQLCPSSPWPTSSPELHPHCRAVWVSASCLLTWHHVTLRLSEVWKGRVLPQPSLLTAAYHPALLVVLQVANQQVGAGCPLLVTAAV